MRKLALLLLLAVASVAAAQQDIVLNPGRSPYVNLGTGVTWGTSGAGGVNNYFIFSPLNPDQRYCLFLYNNNPTSAHTYALTAWQTGNPSRTTFRNNASGEWIQDTVVNLVQTIPAVGALSMYVHANAAAWIAVSITASTTQAGSPDTANIYLVQTTAESCGPVQSGNPWPNSTAANLTAPINSNAIIQEKGARWSAVSAPAQGVNATVSKAAGGSGVRHVADCVTASLVQAAAVAAFETIVLRDGATGVGTTIWAQALAISATAGDRFAINICGLGIIGSANTAMTIEFNAVVAGAIQSVTLTGYDTQ